MGKLNRVSKTGLPSTFNPDLQSKVRGIRSWVHRSLLGGRLGDKRGHIAHGKAKTKTSGHNLIT